MPGKSAGPFAGGFAPQAANFMKNLVFHPCSVPFTIWVETVVPAFIWMVITVNLWDANDIIRNSGEAITQDKTKGGRKGKTHLIKYAMNGKDGNVQGKAQLGLQGVLKLTAPLERIGYTMLLYFATEQFFYNMNSALYDFEFCGRPPSEGPYQANTIENGVTSTGTVQTLFLPIVTQNRGNWPAGAAFVSLVFGRYDVLIELTYNNDFQGDMTVEVGFTLEQAGLLEFNWSQEIVIKPGQDGTVILHKNIRISAFTGGVLRWTRRSTARPVGILIKEGSVTVSQNPLGTALI